MQHNLQNGIRPTLQPLSLSLALFFPCPELKAGLKQSQFESAEEIQLKMLRQKIPNSFKIVNGMPLEREESLES
jgi:hypothetical protein